MFLFLSSSGDHPHLHSFPTRRSSDLPISPTARLWPGKSRRKRSTRPSITCRNATRFPATLFCVPPTRLRPDRKSTRLNSSHLGISYAVFCLKKKKRNKKTKTSYYEVT